MDRIEPIRPSLPPIDTTNVRKVSDERERQAAQRQAAQRQAQQREQERRRQRAREQSDRREWRTDELAEDEDQDGPPRIDVRA